QKKWRCVRFLLDAEPPGPGRFGLNFPDLEKGTFSGSIWLDDFFLAPLPAKREEKPTVPEAALAGWWKCDEGKGTKLGDSSKNASAATFAAGVSWTAGRTA